VKPSGGCRIIAYSGKNETSARTEPRSIRIHENDHSSCASRGDVHLFWRRWIITISVYSVYDPDLDLSRTSSPFSLGSGYDGWVLNPSISTLSSWEPNKVRGMGTGQQRIMLRISRNKGWGDLVTTGSIDGYFNPSKLRSGRSLATTVAPIRLVAIHLV
jgi:hypothetical protein